MHSVCTLYAFPTAYIFVPSALRTRLFSFLYALYAVFFGVVFSYSMHSRFFDAYNAYNPAYCIAPVCMIHHERPRRIVVLSGGLDAGRIWRVQEARASVLNPGDKRKLTRT